jgi:PTH1 family peptidyl-tRNA hydrolase
MAIDSSELRLVVGLGNPGQRYRNTWHNLGARTVEELARRANVTFKPGKGEFFFAEIRQSNTLTTLLIPTSYMNRSGQPVSVWLRYHKVDLSQMLVVYDDHDLALGRIRIRPDGSSGGHHGMDDILRLCGSDKFPRLRIGIRIDREQIELADQVLKPIPSGLSQFVERIVNTSADAVQTITSDGLSSAMTFYNKLEIE